MPLCPGGRTARRSSGTEDSMKTGALGAAGCASAQQIILAWGDAPEP